MFYQKEKRNKKYISITKSTFSVDNEKGINAVQSLKGTKHSLVLNRTRHMTWLQTNCKTGLCIIVQMDL